jgi:hypothetical protein
MEAWTIAVITVESAAQVFYQALKDATGCVLLKQVCTDILIDEAFHIDFQLQRLQIIFTEKKPVQKFISYQFYRLFYFSTIMVVWAAHRKLFKAGNVGLKKYMRKMNFKFNKTIQKLPSGGYADLAAQELITIKHSL